MMLHLKTIFVGFKIAFYEYHVYMVISATTVYLHVDLCV